MGTIVAENGIVEVSRLATALVDELPDDIYVLPQPRVYGVELDWLVVAPSGLYHLDLRDWRGEVRAHGAEPWLVRPDDGPSSKVDSPIKRQQAAREAIEAFLRDETPGVTLPVVGLLVFEETPPAISGLGGEIAVVSIADAIGRILEPGTPKQGLESHLERREIANGFLERQLAFRQKASRPFVLSMGGVLRAKLSARTIEQLIKLLDRYPRVGVRHLLDGSLEEWLENEGAHHLVVQARQSLGRLASDGRAALEAFLTGSGYVGLPRSVVHPRKLSIGYVTSGDSVRKTLSVRRRRGRGYVHGSVGSRDTWIRVEPSRFSGNAHFIVSVDASSLPVGHDSASTVLVQSDVGGETHEILLTMRVRPAPAPIVRRFIRPLLGSVAALLLGGLFGRLWSGALAMQETSSPLGPVVLLGSAIVWAVFGAIRGVQQPAGWPTPYALGKWLLRVLGWAAAMSATVFGLLGLVVALLPDATGAAELLARGQPMLTALFALAVVPGTLDDIASSQAMRQGATIELRARLVKRAQRAGIAVAIGLALVVGGWQLHPLYVQARASRASANIEAKAGGAWTALRPN